MKSKEEKAEQKEINVLLDKFYRLMFEKGLYNKFNHTYNLKIYNKTDYGFYAQIYLVPGLSFADLQDNLQLIQENLKCLWVMEIDQFFTDYAKVKIITHPIDPDFKFENPGIMPNELYLGVDFSKQIQKNDNDDYSMFLLTGATGTGKTRYLYTILTSWIINNKPGEVEIYLSDIAKNEYTMFKDVQHVKRYADDLESLLDMAREVREKLEKRKNKISEAREEGWATNIKEYNRKAKNKLSYCYVVIDEFSVVMPDKSDLESEVKIKTEILDILRRISKIGRSLGIFLLVATQKVTRDEMPSIIKNMSAVRISFRANDSTSSEVVLGDRSAIGLADRYAIFSQNGGEKKQYMFSPYIDLDVLKRLLAPYTIKGKKAYILGKAIEPKSITVIPKNQYKKESVKLDY